MKRNQLSNNHQITMSSQIIPSQYQDDLSLLINNLLHYPDGSDKELADMPVIEVLYELWEYEYDKKKKKSVPLLPRWVIEYGRERAVWVMVNLR